ncbi:hsp70 chaperone [Niveomyces insectorum RCEF 264]|uniref:Hsp70 chaperone n=1 Tax=Niveomyces insectorum RCEF 264 TaxID=1081102 RepID=A0A162K5J4_9HYPO|nr:hsp70 chaperone [Niveomyces insectorum RCEF 264]
MASEGVTPRSATRFAPEDRTAIGISFGNTNSSIAYTFDDRVEVIANEDGDRQIPTILSYVDGEEYYGQQAKNFLVRNASNTVAYFKDLLGRDFADIDPTYCHASAHPQQTNGEVTFSIVDKAVGGVDAEGGSASDTDGKPSAAPTPAEPSTVSVSEVATRYLRRLIGSASDYLGRQVTSAVISVPTNFTDAQRQAIVRVADAAGIEILQLITEPAAVAAAYTARVDAEAVNGTASLDSKDKVIVVADLGGTRSDAAVVASRAGMATVLATVHDYEFVGAALDKVLIDHFAKEFAKKNQGLDPRETPRSLAKLRLESEAAKKALSIGANAAIGIESLADGRDFTSTVNRFRYETLARPVFEGIDRLVETVVHKAGLDLIDVDVVLLSGGTAHTPRIAENLRNLFGGGRSSSSSTTLVVAPSTVPTATNPSELQARGAALQANLVRDFDADEIEQSAHPMVRTVQHTSLAVGVVAVPLAADAAGGDQEVFTPIIAAESAVPVRRAVLLPGPKEGGDVLLRFAEGSTHVHTIPAAKKADEDKKKSSSADDSDASDLDSDDDLDEDEEEDQRKRGWKVQGLLAEAALRGVKRNAKIEVAISIRADMGVSFTAREVGGKAAIRGSF